MTSGVLMMRTGSSLRSVSWETVYTSMPPYAKSCRRKHTQAGARVSKRVCFQEKVENKFKTQWLLMKPHTHTHTHSPHWTKQSAFSSPGLSLLLGNVMLQGKSEELNQSSTLRDELKLHWEEQHFSMCFCIQSWLFIHTHAPPHTHTSSYMLLHFNGN